MKKNIAILMATYNGEKFIKEQIKSILNQTYSDFDLIIRDDCSIDNTVNIIEEMIAHDNRIKLIKSDNNIGQVKNFEQLIPMAMEYNYVMFSDQDDIWLQNKVEKMSEKIKLLEKEQNAVLVYSDLEYVNQNLEKMNLNIDIKYKDLLSYNYIWGCTMILNNNLLKKCYPFGENCQNHDYWIALMANEFGHIGHINEKLTLYRQHNDNVTGGLNNYSYLKKIKKIKKTFYAYEKQFKQNFEFIKLNNLTENCKYKKYFNILKYSKLESIYNIIFNIKLKKNSVKEMIIFYIFIIFFMNKRRLQID